MTVKQVGEYLQMDEHTVYLPGEIACNISRGELARSGQIPSIKIAGQWRLKKEIIDKWISEQWLEGVLQNIKSSSKTRE